MSQGKSLTRHFLLGVAIGAGTTGGLVGLVCLCVYAVAAARLGNTPNALPFFRALFVPTALKLLLGGMVTSIILAALLCRDPRKAAVVVANLFVAVVISCGLVGLTALWSEWTPAPSPQPYPGVKVPYRIEALASQGRCASYSYEVALALLPVQQHYERQMEQYCTGAWGFASTPRSDGACYAATCEIRPRAGSRQYFTVYLCPDGNERASIVQKDCMED